MTKIISKKDAERRGLSRYFIGKPCSRGHLSERSLSGNCLKCSSEWRKRDPKRAKARRTYYLKNKQKENLNCREYHQKNKSKRAEYGALYRDKNKETLYERGVKWRANNKEYGETYRKSNRDKYLIYRENRRAREQTGKLSKGIVVYLYGVQRGLCGCCGTELTNDYQIDHIVPLSRGGLNIDSNVQLTHPVCNRRKGNSTMGPGNSSDFARRMTVEELKTELDRP